ncbi:MAG: hypothetical protein ACJA08_000539 [Cyclobacteriaceae bacterium]|jgi:hypothetical protein
MLGVVELLEGSNLSLDVTAFVDNGIHDAPSLTSFEFFFDDSDLGFASNIISTTTVPLSNLFSGQVDFVTNGLAAGSHLLYLRVADENRWGLYKSYPIYIVDNAIAGFDINAAEYFFNLDPGVGLATPITISRTNTLNLLETIDASLLTTGFHNLFIRVGDQHGRWGLYQSKLLYVDNSSPANTSIIQAVEYYFNDDPGYGVAIPLTANSIDFTDAIVTTDLDPGFHNLFIRAQDDGGIWGLTSTKLLYVDPSGAGLASSIGTFEYFFDDDPGYGAATAITVSTPANEVNLLETLVATSLTTGFHNLFIRSQDAGGTWGLPISKLV